MKAVQLTASQWSNIRAELQEEHPKTVFMLRDKMKKVLGFTVREHNSYQPDGRHKFEIHLDFYSENKRTMFLLKFSELIRTENKLR